MGRAPLTKAPALPWRARLAAEFANRDTTMFGVVSQAIELGFRVNKSSASEIWRCKTDPTDRFVGAISIVLGIHPADLGFDRTPDTEFGFRAYEWEHPEDRRA